MPVLTWYVQQQVVGTSAGVLTLTPDSVLIGRKFVPVTLNSTSPLTSLHGARMVASNQALRALVTPTVNPNPKP